jgi:hypothetical protein
MVVMWPTPRASASRQAQGLERVMAVLVVVVVVLVVWRGSRKLSRDGYCSVGSWL